MKCRYTKCIKCIQLDLNKNCQEVINFAGGDPSDLSIYTPHGIIVDTIDGKVEVRDGHFLVNLNGIKAMTASAFYDNYEIV